MAVKLRKSIDSNRTKSLIEKSRIVSYNPRNNFKSGIDSFKSDAEQPKMTLLQKFVNFCKRRFKRNRKQTNKYTILKSKKIESVKSEKSKPLSQPPSLKNIGSNCYLNAALQGISSCRQFYDDISDLVALYKNEIVNLNIFHDLLFHLNGGTYMSMEISKSPIFQNWNKSSQQDSFELLNYVLNEVYNEIRKYEESKNKIEENNYQQWLKIELPMKILLNYAIRCECGSIEYSPTQSDLAFHLVIHNNQHDTIQNIFENFFQDELIDGYICNNIKCFNNKSYKSVKLKQPIPKTICIHFQKSHFDGIRMRKIKDKIHFEKLLRIKRNFFSVNKENGILSEIEKNEFEKNISIIQNNESNLNIEEINLVENATEGIIKTDKNLTNINKAEDVSNKETKITDNNDINNYNDKTIPNNFRNLKIQDLRSRNSSFLLSLTNYSLLCETEKTDCKLNFSSMVNESLNASLNESLKIIEKIDKTIKSRDYEINYFFRSSVDSSYFEYNHIQLRNETHSSESIAHEKRNAFYDSENKINQNSQNNLENLLNANDFTSNPENSNAIQNENSSNNNVVEDKTDKYGSDNDCISSENLLKEDDAIRKLQNSIEIQNKNGSNNNVVEDKINQNSQINEIISSENLSNTDIISNCQNNTIIQNENSSNSNVVEGKTDKCNSDNSNIFAGNLLNEVDINTNPDNSSKIQNENSSNSNVVEGKTNHNTQNNGSVSLENSLNENDLTTNLQIRDETHSTESIAYEKRNAICDSVQKINQNSQNNEIISSENLANTDITSNCQKNTAIQNENSSNSNVVEGKTDKCSSDNSNIFAENLLNEDDFTSNPDKSSKIQNENISNNNVIDHKINQNSRNNEIISSGNLPNENDLTTENNNEIQVENCLNSILDENKTDHNPQNNGSLSSEKSLNEIDLTTNLQNTEIQNENNSNNNVEDKTDKCSSDNGSKSSKCLINENISNNNVVEEEADHNCSNNTNITSENLLNKSDSTNKLWNNYKFQNENLSNYNVRENKANQNSQINDCIPTTKLENENTISQEDDTFSLKSIIVHLGSVNSGHYVCYKYFNDKWFLADDNRIRKVTEEEVLSSDAYILFYEKN